ncbi:15061_t:CDS:2, partial [Acaulospora morrowiae]
MEVHQELNTLVRNGGRQKQNSENADDEKGSNNNDSVNNEEDSNSNTASTNNEEGIKSDEGADSGNINEAELDILEVYRSRFNNYPAMDLRLHSELSLSLDQELQDKILHE